jgi:hypothetical protein
MAKGTAAKERMPPMSTGSPFDSNGAAVIRICRKVYEGREKGGDLIKGGKDKGELLLRVYYCAVLFFPIFPVSSQRHFIAYGRQRRANTALPTLRPLGTMKNYKGISSTSNKVQQSDPRSPIQEQKRYNPGQSVITLQEWPELFQMAQLHGPCNHRVRASIVLTSDMINERKSPKDPILSLTE